MKVVVVGNCQHAGIAECLQIMAPDFDVRMVATNRQVLADAEIRSVFAGSDAILTQPDFDEELRSAFPDKRVVLYPRIMFAGYYPDFVQAKNGSALLRSPIGNFHSSIAVWAYANKLTADQAVGLFRGEVFDALGFFDVEQASIEIMQAEWDRADMSLQPMLSRWLQRHPFMHATNHPKIFAMADVARQLAKKLEITPAVNEPENYLSDYLANTQIWPVYPEIAKKYGFKGGYYFKSQVKAEGAKPRFEMFHLGEFIERSFRLYREHGGAAISHSRMQAGQYDCLQRFVNQTGSDQKASEAETKKAPVPSAAASQNPSEAPRKGRTKSPYSNLPDHQHWRQAIEQLPPGDVDPVVSSTLRIGRRTAIATAGSCFAQNISRSLVNKGYNYLVTESAPESMAPAEAAQLNYGIFSARYGNVYTARQLDQLFDRAYGKFSPVDSAWRRADGRYVDPFRPRIDPAGYADPADVDVVRQAHLAAVRRMFETADVFVFTLGLTEAWRAKKDGAVFPLAPGVSAGEFDPDRYEFVNFGVEEVTSDMAAFLGKLRAVNPKVQVILTVSPVSLVATYEPRHVLVSTTLSKAVLRVAAQAAATAFGFVHYFPSYEIITGSFSRGEYFEKDARSVTSSGIDHVMRLFGRHYLESEHAGPNAPGLNEEILALSGIVCDEEEIRRARGDDL